MTGEPDRIVSALGREYPRTMLGFQAAAMDAAVAAERARRKPWSERLWRRLTLWELRLWGPPGHGPGLRVHLHPSCLVVSCTDELHDGGRCTWYPLHVRWAWTRRRPPHWRRRRSWGDDGGGA